MEGAALRMKRERELVWLGAMLPFMKKPISLEAFAGDSDPVKSREDRVRRFHAAWDKIDAALERGSRMARGGA